MSQDFTQIDRCPDSNVPIIEISTSTLNDYDVAHATASEIDEFFKDAGARQAIIDLQHIDFVNSVGLVVFSRLLKTVREKDLQVVICNASDMLADVLEATRLVSLGEERISLVADRDAALARFAL